MPIIPSAAEFRKWQEQEHFKRWQEKHLNCKHLNLFLFSAYMLNRYKLPDKYNFDDGGFSFKHNEVFLTKVDQVIFLN